MVVQSTLHFIDNSQAMKRCGRPKSLSSGHGEGGGEARDGGGEERESWEESNGTGDGDVGGGEEMGRKGRLRRGRVREAKAGVDAVDGGGERQCENILTLLLDRYPINPHSSSN